MENTSAIEQPSLDLQALLKDIVTAEPSEFVFRGKKYKIGWLYNETVSRFTKVCLREKNPLKRNVKLCVLLLLNARWKIKFQYWWRWRYLYYFCDLNDVEVLKVLDACKKKIPSTASSLATILSTGMMDTMITMTRTERGAIQAEPRGERPSR